MLEVFLFGGICPWDTFYVVPEHGSESGGPDGPTMWWTFQNTPVSVTSEFARCGGGNRSLLEAPFASDAGGAQVRLGPYLYPLRDRPDIVRRMRMWVMKHDQGAHETGVPLTMCGHPMTSPRMASTAAHVQRFFSERQERTTPYSTVVYPGLHDLTAHNGEAASAVGLHGGSARPVSLRLGHGGLSEEGLGRTTVAGRRDELDAVVRYYTQRYGARLIRPGTGERVRAPAMTDWEAARAALEGAEDFRAVLGPGASQGAQGDECGEHSEADFTTMSLRLGAELLTHPTDAPKWVTVVDGGLLPAVGGGAYDTHFEHVHHSARNLVHTMRELTSRINEPGENDPSKIDLDRQTVLLTTEFGRTPFAIGDGLNHWTEGYVVCAFGGPFDEERAGIVGAIGPDGYATEWVTPADFRAAMLLMQGMWPFTSESFAVGDVSGGATTEAEGTAFLREVMLGYPA